MRVTKAFKIAIKLSKVPAYRLAQKVGIPPDYISKAIHEAIRIKKNDPYIIKVGKLLGMKRGELFEEETL